MPTSADALRRWLGLLFLALSFGFLIWGLVVGPSAEHWEAE